VLLSASEALRFLLLISEVASPRSEADPIDYQPIVAVIGLVVFSLAAIAFILTLRAR
jgi:hypothetical protein